MQRLLASICAALGIYAAAYVLVVKPEKFYPCQMGVRWGESFYCRAPIYRFEHRYAERFFAPALWLDQHIRPKYWDWQTEYSTIPMPVSTGGFGGGGGQVAGFGEFTAPMATVYDGFDVRENGGDTQQSKQVAH